MNRQARFILTRLAQNYYEEFFFFFLLVLAFSIPSSRLVMSMSQIALATLWVLDARYSQKLKLFFKNKIALVLVSLFVLHLLGLFYSNDFDAAFNDLRIKLPLLLLPFFFSSVKPFSKQKAYWILLAFCAGVFYVSLFVSVEHWISGADIKSILSDRFIKHMRFSLNINLAIFSLLFLVFVEWKKTGIKLLGLVVVLWLMVFTFHMGALSAYVIFVLLLVFLLIFALSQTTGKKFIFGAITLFITLVIASSFALFFIEPSFLKSDGDVILPLDKKTAQGNNYSHKPISLKENGKPIYQYVCEKELKVQWNKRSTLSFSGPDKKGQELKATLIRYLTSLDLRKDSLGLSQLSDKDIVHIENGIANVNYVNASEFKLRLMQLSFELEQIKNSPRSDGYSFAQRREYWSVSWQMIKKAWLFGTGTGDNNAIMREGFQETESTLSPELWFHPHNQFLSFWLSFGILGLLLFLFVLFYPPINTQAFQNPLYWFFFLTVLFSFFVEDLLETQSGATYFAFFNAFFIMLWPAKKRKV